MTDDQLRALVHEAVARHLLAAERGVPPAGGDAAAGAPASQEAGQGFGTPPIVRTHASHARYALTSGGDEAGPCLIEPTVACNHCGYCQSHGH